MVSQSQPTTSPTPFYASIPQEKLDRLQKLLRLSPVPPATHDGMVSGFGVSSEWMTMAKNYWENKFSWCVNKINPFSFLNCMLIISSMVYI